LLLGAEPFIFFSPIRGGSGFPPTTHSSRSALYTLPSLDQVKERKLVRWALAYLAGAWLALQVLKLVADSFGWPLLSIRGLIVVPAVGFSGDGHSRDNRRKRERRSEVSAGTGL
jgi:hypothetical protein